jgi:nickel-dependent lactate racemase
MSESYPTLDDAAIENIVAASLAGAPLDGQRMLVLVPDLTRTMPLPLFARLIVRHARPRAQAVDFLVALGTHPPLDDDAMNQLFGMTPQERSSLFSDVGFLNHEWKNPDKLVQLGSISSAEVERISDGLLRMEIPVLINRLVLDYDVLLVCGPVFPHEVAGFSGGNKYFFPGISGPEVIDATHWLGALVTSFRIIGTKTTPVRQVIDLAARLIPRVKYAFCSVVSQAGLHGVFFGRPEEAFDEAAELSGHVHVISLQRPYQRVLSLLPTMYDDMWVGAKGMYKLEPVVADGGEVILYAPHITELSRTHGTLIRKIGYHVRDYFLAQWERFKDYPWGVLAHSTHLKGMGSFEHDVERPRIRVTLATSIGREICEEVNLGYLDPASIDPAQWINHQPDETLVVPHAGETLYRLEQ